MRKPLELFHKFPTGEKVVGMVLYRDKIMIATENALYESDSETITPIEVNLVEPAKLEGDDIMIACPRCSNVHQRGGKCRDN